MKKRTNINPLVFGYGFLVAAFAGTSLLAWSDEDAVEAVGLLLLTLSAMQLTLQEVFEYEPGRPHRILPILGAFIGMVGLVTVVLL